MLSHTWTLTLQRSQFWWPRKIKFGRKMNRLIKLQNLKNLVYQIAKKNNIVIYTYPKNVTPSVPG